MALDTYANLKASIQDWSHRSDVTALVDDFIDLAEEEMFKYLELKDMEARANPTTEPTTRFVALPTGYIKPRRMKLTISGNSVDIRYATPESMQIVNSSGKPKFFTVTSQIEFDRVPDGSYTTEFQYYKKLTALSSGNTTNAVLTDFPSIYLFGGLWALNLWAADEDKAEFYYAKFRQAISSANEQHKKGRYGPAPTLKVEGPTP